MLDSFVNNWAKICKERDKSIKTVDADEKDYLYLKEQMISLYAKADKDKHNAIVSDIETYGCNSKKFTDVATFVAICIAIISILLDAVDNAVFEIYCYIILFLLIIMFLVAWILYLNSDQNMKYRNMLLKIFSEMEEDKESSENEN